MSDQLALDVGTGRNPPPGVVAVCWRCGARYAKPQPVNWHADADDGSPWWPGVALALVDLMAHELECPALSPEERQQAAQRRQEARDRAEAILEATDRESGS